MPASPAQRTAAASVRVTVAQLRVLELLAAGRTYAVIARMLFISPTTVRTHVRAMQELFGVPNNVGLVLAAVVVGVLSADAWPVQLTGLIDFSPGDLQGVPESI